jgi:hypothetical protein
VQVSLGDLSFEAKFKILDAALKSFQSFTKLIAERPPLQVIFPPHVNINNNQKIHLINVKKLSTILPASQAASTNSFEQVQYTSASDSVTVKRRRYSVMSCLKLNQRPQ